MNNQQPVVKVKSKGWGSGSYWVTGLILYFALYRNPELYKTDTEKIIMCAVAIVAGAFFYRLRDRLNFMPTKIVKNFVTGAVLVFVAVGLAGFLIGLGDLVIHKTPSDQTLQERDAIIQKTNEAKIWVQDWQARWDKTQKDIVDDTDSQWGYLNNVAGYQALQKLNAERYDKSEEVFDVIAKYLPLFSNYDMGNMYRVSENLHNSYNELLKAKIDYFQSLVDKKSATEIEARRLIANEKAEKAAVAENEAQAVVTDYNNVLAEVFKK